MNTKYFLNLVAGNIFGSLTEPTIPAEYYIGFSSSTPSIDGSGVTEPIGGGYTRTLISGLSEPVDGMITNIDAISSPRSTEDWGVMTHYVIYDAETDGNLLMFDKLSRSRTVEADSRLTILEGTLRLSVINS